MHDSGKLNIQLSAQDGPATEYFQNSRAQRVNTDAVMLQAIHAQNSGKHVTIAHEYNCNLLSYAARGHAVALPLDNADEMAATLVTWRQYVAPARRLEGESGSLADLVLFGKYAYRWREHEFILYLVEGRDGTTYGGRVRNNYIVGEERAVNQLIMEVGMFSTSLHDEIWVFDQGYWQKDNALWKSVEKASWDDIILDDDMKEAIIGDVQKFFDSREEYKKLTIPWKRGIIFWGPPGNGKTVSIKATMHTLQRRAQPVPTLYVKTIYASEYALGQVFRKARQEAPCYLVFEDLDSVVTDRLRSYFLNEVDGLASNDGILITGSTNHIDRLDPGIAKRPSRFDRKYLFPDPDLHERVKYCEYWQTKLSDNKDIDFPHKLCTAIAKITYHFSFAYIQEAFVAALLTIASREGLQPKQPRFWDSDPTQSPEHDDDDDDELNGLLLWREIKKQIKILREEFGEEQLPPNGVDGRAFR